MLIAYGGPLTGPAIQEGLHLNLALYWRYVWMFANEHMTHGNDTSLHRNCQAELISPN